MKKNYQLTYNKLGQSLLEIVFAFGVVTVCLLAVIIALTASIRNTGFAKNNQLASRYAYEGLDAARKARDRSATWNAFSSTYNNDWCLDSSLTWSSCDCAAANPTPNVGNFFRCATFTTETAGSRKRVTATVSWQESGNTHEVEATTFLTEWGK